MGSLTSSLDTRAGTGLITLNHTDFPDGTFEIFDISELGIKFDLEDNADNAESVYFAPSEFKFTMQDKLDTTDADDSFFSHLDDVLSTDDVQASLYFETDGGHTFTDVFTFTKNDATYNRLDRSVKIESNLKVFGDVSYSDFFSDYIDDRESIFDKDKEQSSTCMPLNKVLENIFKATGLSGKTFVNTTKEYSDNPFSGSKTWVLVKPVITFPGNDNVVSDVYRSLVMDGSVIGSLLGYNFVSHRLSTSDDVQLSEDDVEKLDIEFGVRNYSSVFTTFNSPVKVNFDPFGSSTTLGEWGVWGHLLGDSDGLNSDAKQRLRVYFSQRSMQPATWDGADFVDDSSSFYTDNVTAVDGDHDEDDKILAVLDGSGISHGDVIMFDEEFSIPHLVEESSSNALKLETGLLSDIPNNAKVDLYTTPETQVAQDAAEAYAQAYGANGARHIKLTLLDIDSFNPNQTFTLDTSFPDAVKNRTYRPAEIDYNLFTDKVTIEAYEIA